MSQNVTCWSIRLFSGHAGVEEGDRKHHKTLGNLFRTWARKSIPQNVGGQTYMHEARALMAQLILWKAS